jgi:mRNA-degrading endonuclease RelE of RelBE toxin-antitoxin system
LTRVVLARRALDEFRELDNRLTAAAGEALRLLEREPHAGHALRGPLVGLRSLRVGALRIIYRDCEPAGLVAVAAIRHRTTAP